MDEIVIVDYGMGNLGSVEKALKKVGCRVRVSDVPSSIEKAKGIILPGVGSFKDCMRGLEKHNLIEPLLKFIHSGGPFLGICLGMQILFSESEEFGHSRGLDVLKGKVVRFPVNSQFKIPHMGWNRIRIRRMAPLLKGIPDGSYFYFVHSFYVVPEDENIIATSTQYGLEFASSVWKNNIFACQFHPEKSQSLGLSILKRFGEIIKNAGQADNSLS